MRPVSLYLHIPFCKRRCAYCTFYHVQHVDDFETAFVGRLVEELDTTTSLIGGAFETPTVFFGGGTPSVLETSSLERIFDAIEKRVGSGAIAEMTLEANPEDVDSEILDFLCGSGVNRLSLGVQSMQSGSQRVLRRCAPELNERALDLVAQRFDNFSVDLLLGIPGADRDAIVETMIRVQTYEPSHYSVYCLEPGGVMESGVAGFFDRVDSDQAADEYLTVCETLAAAGYDHYEISNFARPGRESIHNRNYWIGGEWIGVGPGAHSFVGGLRFHNEPSIERYVNVESFPDDIRREEPRDEGQTLMEDLMLALRTSAGLETSRLACDPVVIAELVGRGLARLDGDRLRLTDRGYLLHSEIVLRLLATA